MPVLKRPRIPSGMQLVQNPNRAENIGQRTWGRQAGRDLNEAQRARIQGRIDKRIANPTGPGSRFVPIQTKTQTIPPEPIPPIPEPGPIPDPIPDPSGPVLAPIPPDGYQPAPGGPIIDNVPGWDPSDGFGGVPGDQFPEIPGTPPFTPIPGDGGIDPVLRRANEQRFPDKFGFPEKLRPRNFNPQRGAPQKKGVEVGTDQLSRLVSGAFDQLIGSGGAPQSDLGVASDQALYNFLANPPRPPELISPEATGLEQSVTGALMQTLGSGGDFNQALINARAESARENLERFRRAEEQTLGSRLANRGLMGSGAERTGLEGLSGNIAGQFATAMRDIMSDERAAAGQRYAQALGTGTQAAAAQRGEALQRQALGEQQGARYSADQLRALDLAQRATQGAAGTLLQSVGMATQRQDMLGRLALDNLAQSTAFNQFLAQFGLDREQTLEAIQTGRYEQLIPLLDSFFQGAGVAQKGAI